MPKITIDREQCNGCGKCVEICPKQVLVKVRNSVEVRKLLDCMLCEDCHNVCPKTPPAIKVSWEKNSFIFNIESNGVLPFERIITEALKILEKKCNEFKEEILGLGEVEEVEEA